MRVVSIIFSFFLFTGCFTLELGKMASGGASDERQFGVFIDEIQVAANSDILLLLRVQKDPDSGDADPLSGERNLVCLPNSYYKSFYHNKLRMSGGPNAVRTLYVGLADLKKAKAGSTVAAVYKKSDFLYEEDMALAEDVREGEFKEGAVSKSCKGYQQTTAAEPGGNFAGISYIKLLGEKYFEEQLSKYLTVEEMEQVKLENPDDYPRQAYFFPATKQYVFTGAGSTRFTLDPGGQAGGRLKEISPAAYRAYFAGRGVVITDAKSTDGPKADLSLIQNAPAYDSKKWWVPLAGSSGVPDGTYMNFVMISMDNQEKKGGGSFAHKLLYGLYPVTIALDVATSPVQAGILIYRLP